MDSNITIKIVEPGSGPIDPVVPNTGLFTNGIGGPEATIIVVSAVILLVALIAAILYYRKKKQGKVDSFSTLLKTLLNSTKHKKATTLGLTALALLVSVGTFTAFIKNAVQAAISDIPETSEETTSTAKVEDGELVVELGNTPVFAYIPTTITVEEEMPAGYTLKAYSANSTLSSEGTDKTISIIPPANTTTSTSELQDNTWGLATEEPTSETQQIYYSLPETAEDAIIIKSIDDYSPTPAGDTTTVYYGVYITPDMPYGTYTGATVSYEVEPNRSDLATVTFDGNGLTFDGAETNVVRYERLVTDKTEVYAHTSNVDDEGTQTPGEMYPIGVNKTIVYEFADASEVKLHLVKMEADGTCGPNEDQYFSFWQGNHPDYTAVNNWESGVKVSGSNGKYTFANGYQYAGMDATVEGNTLTFAYTTSDHRGSYCGNSGYGFYAIITATDADGNPAYAIGNVPYSGTYATPATTEYDNYEFLGWSLDPNAASADYTDAADVEANMPLNAGEKVTLYAVWSPVVSFNYDGNNATAGSMESTSYDGETPTTVTLAHEDIIAGNTINLYAPNYKKTGYGFVGWSTDENAWTHLTDDDESNDPVIYGPNQTFTMTKDMAVEAAKGKDTLYAIWAPAEEENGSPVALQNWTGCSNLTPTTYDTETGTLAVGKNTITALTDNRDGNVYTIARLSDGNCWMTENLRLNNEATISTTNTNNPITVDNNVAIKNNDGNTYNHLSPNSNSWCTNWGSEECYNQSYLNTFNTNLGGQDAIASYNGSYASDKAFQWYSYGNYYNWYSATAGNGKWEATTTVSGDICPAGWSLPIGGETQANASFSNLDSNMGGTGNYHSGSNNWRSFPNNFVYSGRWYGSSVGYRGYDAYYWSSTADGTGDAYRLTFSSDNVSPGTSSDSKYLGHSVRCVAPVE